MTDEHAGESFPQPTRESATGGAAGVWGLGGIKLVTGGGAQRPFLGGNRRLSGAIFFGSKAPVGDVCVFTAECLLVWFGGCA